MKKQFEMPQECDKAAVSQREFDKLTALFADVDESKRQLVGELIQNAAFMAGELAVLRVRLEATGMVKVHPDYPEIQKPIEAARQYRQTVDSYAIVIKTLNGILDKSGKEEEDDDMEGFE